MSLFLTSNSRRQLRVFDFEKTERKAGEGNISEAGKQARFRLLDFSYTPCPGVVGAVRWLVFGSGVLFPPPAAPTAEKKNREKLVKTGFLALGCWSEVFLSSVFFVVFATTVVLEKNSFLFIGFVFPLFCLFFLRSSDSSQTVSVLRCFGRGGYDKSTWYRNIDSRASLTTWCVF